MRLLVADQIDDAVLTLGSDGATLVVVKRGLLSRRAELALSQALVLADQPVDEVPYPDEVGVQHAID